MANRTRIIAGIGSVLLGLSLVACSSGSNTPGDAGSNSASADCAAYTNYGDLSGKTVSMYATFIDTEGTEYEASFKKFEQCTGATIKYEGSKDFTTQLPVRVTAGTAPDIAVLPQPGLLASMVATGKVVEPPAAVGQNVDKYWTKSWRTYGTVDGKFYAAPLGASAKSFIWYSPKQFTDKGYQVPKTWDDLLTLTAKIAADDGTASSTRPWCAGIADGSSSGWPATDWLEDMVLRVGGGEVYDQWVSHQIPFNDPKIVESLNDMGKILKNPDYVNGGIGNVQSIATEPWTDAGFPIADGTCSMMRQASFYAANFTETYPDLKVAPDGDIWAFPFPGMTADSQPVIGGGDFVAAFSDRPEVQAFQTYLSTPEWANQKAANTSQGWTTANNGLDKSLLKSQVDQLAFETLSNPKAEFRFDGSDLMPSEVGSGSFWKQMTDYFAQDKSAEDVLTAIEASWPAS